MLRDGKRDIDAGRFGRDQATLLRFALADPRVDRILVDPVIKLALCRGGAGAVYFGKDWLRRLEPWPGHDDHFHVRLRCPESSPSCVPSDDLPEGDGCDTVSLNGAAPPPSRDSHAQQAALMATACRRLSGR
jgi:penicillin-insensitive murein endopeptidase